MMNHKLFGTLAAVAIFATSGLAAKHLFAASPVGPSGYHVIKTIPIAGDTGWDYLLVDSVARRVYVSRGTHVVVLDADTYEVAGDIPDTQGVHGIAIAPNSAEDLPVTGAPTRRRCSI